MKDLDGAIGTALGAAEGADSREPDAPDDQRALAHVRRLLGRSAPSSAGDPEPTISSLLGELLAVLRLDLACIRFRDSGKLSELRQSAAGERFLPHPEELGVFLEKVSRTGQRHSSLRAQNPFGDEDMSIVSLPLGLGGDLGMLVAGSLGANFPDDYASLLLDAAACRATILLQEARILHHEHVDAALRESDRRARAIIDGIPGFIITLEPDGEIESVNRPVLEYTGHSLENVKQWSRNGIVHAEDRLHVSETFSTSIAAGTPYEIEQRLRRHDGVYRWFGLRGNPARDAAGRIVRWYVLMTDIDERKRAEEALRDRQRELKVILNTLPGGIGVVAPNGNVEFVNDHLVRYHGKSEEELKQWGTSDVVHPEDFARVVENYTRAIETGEPYDTEARMLGADGNYRWFHVRSHPFRDANGQILHWYALHVDIDDRKRAEQALAESERESRLIVNTIPALVVTFLPDGESGSVNQQTLDYFGGTCEQFKNWTANGAAHPDDVRAVAETVGHSLAAGVPYAFEMRLRRFDGVYRWFQIRGNPLRDADGGLVRWYSMMTNVDDRRQAEEALGELRSELARIARISSLGVLTAAVAHEVSQPLSGIITNASTCVRMLSARPPNVEGAIETARRTLRDGNRASEVVARLRALFSKQTEQHEDVDLNEAAAEVIALIASDLQRNRAMLRVDRAAELPLVRGDRVQLQQVILNLLLNASDAMSGVTDRQRALVLRTVRDGEAVTLSVTDVGVGFASEDAERLFEAFYTTKNRGMGIGLSVSRSIIESHDGRLWGEPNAGPGATFSFSIPLVPKQRTS